MTPLAMRIVKELTLPLRQRTFDDCGGLLQRMDDVHCFEVSAALGAVDAILSAARSSPDESGAIEGVARRSGFLPAPKTWIEWMPGARERFGVLLVEQGIRCEARFASGTPAEFRSHACDMELVLSGDHAGRAAISRNATDAQKQTVGNLGGLIFATLAVINAPRIIGRRQHMPHRGLERRLLASRHGIGKFPLHAWTEIKLEITPPRDANDDAPVEARLTGAKALHFCRAHLRVRNGALEMVRSHWRGDPALGIRQSRYTLVGPKGCPT